MNTDLKNITSDYSKKDIDEKPAMKMRNKFMN